MSDLEAHLQSQEASEAGRFWHRLRWRAISGEIPADQSVELLDLGAGAGVLGELVSVDRPRTTYSFCEPIESLETQLVAKYGSQRRVGPTDDLRRFDVITLLDVIEHVDDDRGLLLDTLGRARDGATVVITVPALPGLWSAWDEALGHRRRYTRRTLESLLAPLPIEVQSVRYLFPELLLPALVRRKRPANGAEWPTLKPGVDHALYVLGLPSIGLRRIWPLGTSLLAIGVVRNR